MKVVIALDSFKGSLSAKKACQVVLKAFKKYKPNNEYLVLPILDGGEGLVEVLSNEQINVQVTGPIGKPTKAVVGFLDDNKTVVFEMSSASGYTKVPENKRTPLNTTSYGVGELVMKILDYPFENLIVGMGGSATNDLGLGALMAIGVKFLNNNNQEVDIFGKDLLEVEKIGEVNVDERLKNKNITILTDVENKLLGPAGATYIFGPQKGLKDEELETFDKAFNKVAKMLNEKFQKSIEKIPGSGAAGGLAYGLATVLDAKIEPGFKTLYHYLSFDNKLIDADVIVTGEGRFDDQSLKGKAPYELASISKKTNEQIKIYCFTGENKTTKNIVEFAEIFTINKEGLSLKENIKKTKQNLYKKAVWFAKEYL